MTGVYNEDAPGGDHAGILNMVDRILESQLGQVYLHEAKERARARVRMHWARIEAVAEALLDREELAYDEVLEIIGAVTERGAAQRRPRIRWEGRDPRDPGGGSA